MLSSRRLLRDQFGRGLYVPPPRSYGAPRMGVHNSDVAAVTPPSNSGAAPRDAKEMKRSRVFVAEIHLPRRSPLAVNAKSPRPSCVLSVPSHVSPCAGSASSL